MSANWQTLHVDRRVRQSTATPLSSNRLSATTGLSQLVIVRWATPGEVIADDVHPFADFGAGVVDVEHVEVHVHEFGPLRVDARAVFGFDGRFDRRRLHGRDRAARRSRRCACRGPGCGGR